MKSMCIYLIFISLILSGCNQTEPSVTKKKPIIDCVYMAISFYAKGGEVFDVKGCNVTTARNQKNVIISAHDEFNGYNRTFSANIPISWFKEEIDKMAQLDGEFSHFTSCFTQEKEEDKARNPLMKAPPKDNDCRWISLTINNIPGVRFECKNAPHLSFEALKQQ